MNDKPAMQSKKFRALLIGAALMVAVIVFAFEKGTPKDALEGALYPLLFLFSGYLGSTAWLDRGVRLASVRAGQPDPEPKT